tara:strand:+ start:249 stop:1244 length:996 start_codon:yes stop_codon:yes gene_type:complete
MSFRKTDLGENQVVQIPQTNLLETIKQNTATLTNTDNAGNLNVNIQAGATGGDATASNQTNGNQITQIKGNTLSNGSGDSHFVHVDSNGNVKTIVVNSLNVIPSDSTNSKITDSPSNSMAVGLKARQTQGTASSESFITCSSSGELNSRISSVNGNINVKLEDLSSSIDAEHVNNSRSLPVTLKLRKTITDQTSGVYALCDDAGKIRNVSDNLYKQVITNHGLANAQGVISPSIEMNCGSGSNVEVYINYGGSSGAVAGNFTFQVHESWDDVDYFLTSSATFGQVTQNTDLQTPKAVKTGMFQFDGRFLRVSVTNNSGNIQTINAYVYVKH